MALVLLHRACAFGTGWEGRLARWPSGRKAAFGMAPCLNIQQYLPAIWGAQSLTPTALATNFFRFWH